MGFPKGPGLALIPPCLMGTSEGGVEGQHMKVFAEPLHRVTLQKPGGLSNTKRG